MVKKNRISIFGKSFHVTPAGKILPLGKKKNIFTKCMTTNVSGKMTKGRNLSPEQIKANKKIWQTGLTACSGADATKVADKRQKKYVVKTVL